jgi:metal-dependent amidase/aminoacylase/carboxypeptidase family protein
MGRGEPGQAAIEVNLAVYDNALRARLLERIEAVAGTIVRSAGGTLRSEVDYALPAVVNDDHVTAAVDRAARHVIGQANIITNWRNRFSDTAVSCPRIERRPSCRTARVAVRCVF